MKELKGLIIRAPWIDMILDGTKTWEIRGSNTKIRGKIALIKSGTGKIYGTAELVNSIPIDDETSGYAKPYAWVLQNPIRYTELIPYEHPQGAVIWVNLRNTNTYFF